MKPVVKIHKRTREVVGRYASLTDAARENGIGITTIRYAVNGVSSGNFYYRLADDFDPDEDFAGRRNCPVIVRDVDTGQTAWFGCASAAAERLCSTTNRIYCAARDGNKILGRFIVKYYGKRIS